MEGADSTSADAGFDVFLSHSSADKPAVEVIARRLVAAGVRPYLDRWHLAPGTPWQEGLTSALAECGSVAVFIGPSGTGPWQAAELQIALDRAVRSRDEFRVIPVLLPGTDVEALDGFLGQRTWVDFRPGLDDETAFQRFTAGIRGEAFTDDRFELPDEPAPYRGLLRFESDHAAFFFGRERETSRLFDLVRERRFVAVVGASGTGKSSLVRAGLLPRLAGDGPPRWVPLVCTPGSDPFRSLAARVAELAPGGVSLSGVDELVQRFRTRDDGLVTAVNSFVTEDERVLVVVDQYEELLTLAPADDDRERERFVANLASVVDDPGGRVSVVITMRADFIASALAIPGMAALLQDRQLVLGALTGEQLREAIVRPAEQVGAFFEKGLVAAIIADVEEEPGALPLLQHDLFELWQRRRGPWLTIDAYLATGGVSGSLTTHAEEVYHRLPSEQQELARTIFLRLTSLGEGVPDTRRRSERRELYPVGTSVADVDAALLALSAPDARLVVIDGDMVEVSHEALLQKWDRLRRWLDEDREALRVHNRLSRAADEWAHRLDRDPAALYAGARLAEALELTEGWGDRLNELERSFVDESAAREISEIEFERRQVRSLRRRLLVASVALVLAIVGGVVSAIAFERARREDARAERFGAEATSLATATRADDIQGRNPALGLALAAESSAMLPPGSGSAFRNAARGALIDAHAAFARRTFQPVGEALVGHTEQILTVAVSTDGALVASAGIDRDVLLWDATSTDPEQLPSVLRGSTSTVWEVAFHPRGSHLAAASADGSVHVWDLSTGRRTESLVAGGGAVRAVAYSPDGSMLASAHLDGGVRIWEPDAGSAPIAELWHEPDETVESVAFRPDGALLASAGDDIRLWDLSTFDQVGATLEERASAIRFDPRGEALATAGGTLRLWDAESLTLRREPVEIGVGAVAFSPDGSRLVTAGGDGAVRLWETATGRPIGGPLLGHGGAVESVAFDMTGQLLVSGGIDGTVRRWDVSTTSSIEEIVESHDGPVWDVAFDPVGRLLASSGNESVELRVLRDDGPPPVRFDPGQGRVQAVAFAPDGERLATASTGGIQLWSLDLEPSPIGPPLDGVTGSGWAVGFHPDGSRLAGGAQQALLRLWDLTSEPPRGRSLDGHEQAVPVWGLAFDPAGDVLASASGDTTVRLWDGGSGEPLGPPLDGHNLRVWAVAFSPDGAVLASGSDDGTVVLWDVERREQLGPALVGHLGSVLDVAFSPDGSVLVSADSAGTVRFWDPETGGSIGSPLDSETGGVNALAFSPDGAKLALAGSDGTVRVWTGLWDVELACELALRHVGASQIEEQLTGGREPAACTGESR